MNVNGLFGPESRAVSNGPNGAPSRPPLHWNEGSVAWPLNVAPLVVSWLSGSDASSGKATASFVVHEVGILSPSNVTEVIPIVSFAVALIRKLPGCAGSDAVVPLTGPASVNV